MFFLFLFLKCVDSFDTCPGVVAMRVVAA
jgi:hypothetical protein